MSSNNQELQNCPISTILGSVYEVQDASSCSMQHGYQQLGLHSDGHNK